MRGEGWHTVTLDVVQLCLMTPWTAARQASLSITNSRSSLKPMSMESVMPSSHLTLCRPLLPPSVFPSVRVLSHESRFTSGGQSIGASASASDLPTNIHPFLWFPLGWTILKDFLTVQGTLKSFLQYHSSKASILRCSAFFIVQLSSPYLTTGKTIYLTRRTFLGKVMSLLFNILCSGSYNNKWIYNYLKIKSLTFKKLKIIPFHNFNS